LLLHTILFSKWKNFLRGKKIPAAQERFQPRSKNPDLRFDPVQNMS
jgi:hypothetical protein